jgi:hypothetical protein
MQGRGRALVDGRPSPKSVVLGALTNESVLNAEDDLVEFGGKSDGEGLGKQLGVT